MGEFRVAEPIAKEETIKHSKEETIKLTYVKQHNVAKLVKQALFL
jgi:hypothetical protein